jgi:hypothetical protein
MVAKTDDDRRPRRSVAAIALLAGAIGLAGLVLPAAGTPAAPAAAAPGWPAPG